MTSPGLVAPLETGEDRAEEPPVARRMPMLTVFLDNRLAVLGTAIVLFFLAFCFLGPLFYHTNQVQTDIPISNEGPSLGHLLGTDNAGFDMLGRLMQGGQITLLVGILAAVLATAIGVLWGAAAGYAGGAVDTVMMRVVDTLLAIPTLFLLIFLDSIFRPSGPLLIIVIGGLAWLVPARLVRAEALSLRTRPYVDAARNMGSRPERIILRHIIPNVFGTVMVNATFQVADAILTVAALSFLGLGIPPPGANWGSMLSDGVSYVFAGYWWQIWPAGVCIVSVVVGFNFVGDGLRDVVEVRLQKR